MKTCTGQKQTAEIPWLPNCRGQNCLFGQTGRKSDLTMPAAAFGIDGLNLDDELNLGAV